MVCPKCGSTKVEDVEKVERGTIVFDAVHIIKGVHPFAERYGVEPEEKFKGVMWTCEECNFEFYTREKENVE